MSRLVILICFFCLLCNHMTPTKAAAPCNFLGISNCWSQILSKYCKDGVCEENPNYCKDKDLLAECFQVNCDLGNNRETGWLTLFTGVCRAPFMQEDDSEKK